MRWARWSWLAVLGFAICGLSLVHAPPAHARPVLGKTSPPKVKKKKKSGAKRGKKPRASAKRVLVRKKARTPVKRRTRNIRPKRSVRGGTAKGGTRTQRRTARAKRPSDRRTTARRTTTRPANKRSAPVRKRTPAEQDRAGWERTGRRVREVIRGGALTRGGRASGQHTRGEQRPGAARRSDSASALTVSLPAPRDRDAVGVWTAPPKITGGPGVRPAAHPISAPPPPLPELTNDSIAVTPAVPASAVALAAPSTTARTRPRVRDDLPAEPPGWFEGLALEASFSNWVYQPLSTKTDSAAWANTTTTEVYDIDPATLWQVGLRLDTRWLRLRARYESDVGFDFTGRASLLNVLVAFSGLEELSFELRRMDFQHGTVQLTTRGGGRVLETADFDTELTRGELRYTAESGLYAFGRMLLQGLPRNVYLADGAGTETQYFQVSDQLLDIETEQYMLGLGWSSTAPLDVGDPVRDSGLTGGVHLGVGFGPYTIHTLAEHQYLDEGWLMSLSLGGHIAWRAWVTEDISVGVRDTLSLNPLAPVGLPDDLKRGLRRDGVDTDGYDLDFGAADLLNEVQLFATMNL